MSKVIILIGMPGSGKSTYLENNFPSIKRGDDFHGHSLDNTRTFVKSRCYEELKQTLREGNDYVISDIEYCNSDDLAKAKAGLNALELELGIKIEIKEIYFANDPNACRHNVVHRFHKEPTRKYIEELGKIDILSLVYTPPAESLPIVTCCKEI